MDTPPFSPVYISHSITNHYHTKNPPIAHFIAAAIGKATPHLDKPTLTPSCPRQSLAGEPWMGQTIVDHSRGCRPAGHRRSSMYIDIISLHAKSIKDMACSEQV
jgi:hypothetical protein